jgi:hypothetical protein
MAGNRWNESQFDNSSNPNIFGNSSDFPSLFLENGLRLKGLARWSKACFYDGLGILVLTLLLVIPYVCCKRFVHRHTKRCTICADHPGTCRKATLKWTKTYNKYFERISAWVLVDVFRTPHLKKELKNGNIHIIIEKTRSYQHGIDTVSSAIVGFLVLELFLFYVTKFVLDLFVKFTPTCMNRGHYGRSAYCYALGSVKNGHQINCTTWNTYSESQDYEKNIGPLVCISLYHDALQSMTEIVALLVMQILIMQVIVPIVLRMMSEKRSRIGFAIYCAVFFVAQLAILPWWVNTNTSISRMLHTELFYKQYPIVPVLSQCVLLTFYTLMIIDSDADDLSYNEEVDHMEANTHAMKLELHGQKTPELSPEPEDLNW